MTAIPATSATSTALVRFMWLEITGKCQLECVHCYAESGPDGTAGSMSANDWHRVIDEAAAIGVRMVQFIGGEPTLHPDLPDMVQHALDAGLEIELFSNLVHVTPRLWELIEDGGVRLATSYYSTDPVEHATITRRNTHARTRANLAEAARRGIPVRVGIIGVQAGQDVQGATADLNELGVTDIGVDHLRQVGRGIRRDQPTTAQLCGNCGQGVAAVAPDGAVWPCVFSRWLPVGNVLQQPLAEILHGDDMRETSTILAEEFAPREMPCVPKMCNPQCGPSCSPACRPANNCRPVGACVPGYR